MALASPTVAPHVAPVSSPGQGWGQRSGLPGKLLLWGGIAGLLFTFFPAVSATMTITLFGSEKPETVRELVIASWPGKLGLGLYIACIVFAFQLYPAQPGTPSRNRLLAALACGGVAVLCAIWIFISALTAEARLLAELKEKLGSLGESIKLSCSVGLGAYLMLLASLAVAAGAGLKAKEEEVF